MNDQSSPSEENIKEILKSLQRVIFLTESEKVQLIHRIKAKARDFRSGVTKPNGLRYKLWTYQFNWKGVIMPLIPWIIAGLLVIGGGTAVVADTAIPGNPLYKLDQLLEKWQERLTTSESGRVRLYSKLSEERLAEWQALQRTDPNQLTERAKELWEQHNEAAAERIASSIERLNQLQAEFEIKLQSAVNDNQKAAFQRILKQLETIEGRRQQRLEEIKDREFPGIGALVQRQARLKVWQQLPEAERVRIKTEVRDEIIEFKQGLRNEINQKILNSLSNNSAVNNQGTNSNLSPTEED